MRLSLRARYFRSLAGLLALAYGGFLLLLVLFNLHESREAGHNAAEEWNELLALVALMTLTLPITLWAAWKIAGQLLRPLRQVASTAERIRAGNLAERIPVEGPRDELRRLAEVLNEAFERYAEGVARLDRFSADASHQLRTPLAAMRAEAEVCLQQPRAPEEYRESLGHVLEQVGRMQRTIDQLLQLARLDPILLRSAERWDLRRAVQEWFDDTGDRMRQRRIQGAGPAPGEAIPVLAHPGLMREAFANVLDNALAATPEGGCITCSVERLPDGRVAWWMEDSGPGIPPEERARVRDRFYRGAHARGAGSGLGLAIVQQIVELHGGLLEIGASATLGGACVRVVIPANGTRP